MSNRSGGRGELIDTTKRALMIVERCLALDLEARKAFIDEACSGSPELAEKVRLVLAMEDTGTALFSTEALSRRHGAPDPIPERIGKFRVTGLIGRGGMGIVVKGERDDGMFRQTVAIKLIRADLRDERDRERFANERRLLARLSHPSIAHILDGGEHEGRPYLVMEFVAGDAVTDQLKARDASLAEILDSFSAIAEAVSHAHRNLVIHGDIKPSNVVRTDEGGIKLLDFGIGRLTEELETDAEAYPLTRGFAAAERVAGEPPGIASDVYSLGVLLHLMLSGRMPEDGKAMSALAEAPDSPVEAKRLRGDLDAIVAKALSHDPAQRYADVAALEADLQRYRECRPVAARPREVRYVAGRFLRRNRTALAAAAAILLILTTATIVSTALFLDARTQRASAEARFNELRSLAKFQLFELYDQLTEAPGTTAARARLAAEAQLYLDRLAALPGAPADLRLDVARGLNRLASVQGAPRQPNLGRPAQARANLARAAAILDALVAEQPGDPAVAVERARNRVLRAQMATWIDFQTDAGRKLLEEARLPAGIPAEQAQEIEALRRSAWVDLLGWEEKYPETRRAADEMLDWLDRWAGERPVLWHLSRADALNARGDALYYLGDPRAALADYRAADALLKAAAKRWPRRAAIFARQMVTGYAVVSTLDGLGGSVDALPLSLELVRRGETLMQLEPNDSALRRRYLLAKELTAQLLAGAGRHSEAIVQQQQVAAERAGLLARQPQEPQLRRDLAFSHSVLGNIAWEGRRRDQACRSWRLSEQEFTRLAAVGRLNAFDRDRNLSRVRFNLEICQGTRPASDYRPPV